MNEEMMFSTKEIENFIKEWGIKSAIGVLDKLEDELKDYIIHSPYIKSFMDCFRLKDDVVRIIEKCKEDLINESKRID